MKFNLPEYVLFCLNTLENNGFEAYCVGGAVRDHLMGKIPFDYDITTNATPNEITSLFPKTVPTGIKHGTVTVVTDSGNVEITTYRSDGLYSNNRSPECVTFEKNVESDLSRRDFTMNAICYNPKSGIYDPLNGVADINNKIIRAIGNPKKRFREDALRIIRAFRFAAQLNFRIEQQTLTEAIELLELLQNISVERIYTDLCRILISPHPENAKELFYNNGLKYLGFTIDDFSSELNKIPNILSLRIAYLALQNNFDASIVLKNLKADNKTIADTVSFYNLIQLSLPDDKVKIKKILSEFGVEKFQKYIEMYRNFGCDTIFAESTLISILNSKEPYALKMLNISGNDIKPLVSDGKEIGNILNKLLFHVIENPNDNNLETLLNVAKSFTPHKM